MRSWIRKNLNQLVTILFFAALLVYFVNNKEALSGLLAVPWWIIGAQLLLKSVRIFVTGLFTKFTLAAFAKKVSVRETNYLSLLSSLGNFFGPILGGASIRALYLKKKHNFEYSRFISTLYGFYVVSFATNALLGILLLGYFFHTTSGEVRGFATVMTVLTVILAGNVALMLLPTSLMFGAIRRLKFLPDRLAKIITTMINGWDIIRTNRPLLVKLFFLNIAIAGIAAIESYLLYFALVEEFTIISVLLYTILGTFSVLVSFTPGAMGIKEGIYLFTSSIILLSSEQVLQMATIDRSATFILLFITFITVKISGLDKRFAFESDNERGEQ